MKRSLYRPALISSRSNTPSLPTWRRSAAVDRGARSASQGSPSSAAPIASRALTANAPLFAHVFNRVFNGSMTQPICGARYEITVDGKPRSHRDTNTIALEAGQYLKSKNPNVVAVRDLIGETIVIKNPPPLLK